MPSLASPCRMVTPLRLMLTKRVLGSRFSCLANHSSVAEKTHLSMMVIMPLSSAEATIFPDGMSVPFESRTRSSISKLRLPSGSCSDMMGCISRYSPRGEPPSS